MVFALYIGRKARHYMGTALTQGIAGFNSAFFMYTASMYEDKKVRAIFISGVY